MSVQFLRRDEKIVEDEGMLQNGPSNESTVFRKLKISIMMQFIQVTADIKNRFVS